MKVKKVLNQKSDTKVVQMTDVLKNGNIDVLSNLSPLPLPNDTLVCNQCPSMDTTNALAFNHCNDINEEKTTEDQDFMSKMPTLKTLPVFCVSEGMADDTLPQLSSLKPLPDLIIYESINLGPNDPIIDTNISFDSNQVINDNNVCNQSNEQILDPNIFSDLDRIIGELPEILDFSANLLPIESDVTSLLHNSCVNTNMSSTINCDSTQVNPTNVIDNSKSDHNFVDNTQSSDVCEKISKTNQSINESIVSIDLSDVSNSPPTNESNSCSRELPITDAPIPSTSQTDSVQKTPINTKETDFRLNNGISKQSTSQNSKRSPSKVKSIRVPLRYCANNFRLFNYTRQSARHKNSTQNDEYDYENNLLSNMSWDQIDGSQYEAKVIKWSEEDMDEDKRKDILRNVEQMNFVKSIYESDRNVFYCWDAFEKQSSNSYEQVLRCLMRLDQSGVKRQRFAKYQTHLFLLCGSSVVTTENGKQKKSIEVGQEVVIPPHTRFELEARGIESSYFYVIVSNSH